MKVLKLLQGHFRVLMKIEWMTTNVTAIEAPTRAESEDFRSDFWRFLAN